MKDLIVKGIQWCLENHTFKRVIRITYTGKAISLNDFYAQGHWSVRYNKKAKFSKQFQYLFESNDKLTWLNSFYLVVIYNSRHDVDNVVGMSKVFVDSLKQEKDPNGNVIKQGYVEGDGKKHFKGLHIVPDPTLPYNTFEFLIIEPEW